MILGKEICGDGNALGIRGLASGCGGLALGQQISFGDEIRAEGNIIEISCQFSSFSVFQFFLWLPTEVR